LENFANIRIRFANFGQALNLYLITAKFPSFPLLSSISPLVILIGQSKLVALWEYYLSPPSPYPRKPNSILIQNGIKWYGGPIGKGPAGAAKEKPLLVFLHQNGLGYGSLWSIPIHSHVLLLWLRHLAGRFRKGKMK
jgi:hypothetical protein